ncbi:hypothetical protein [Cytophaga sp. FL35]|uniref:hypothetical protein n=1 Tax=Cytophaga sp. FL35 TaxID=1904456 RepID=UPI00165386BD|nr:hypothetical protein [Cytophaga sp. FL35]MBC6999686.1 hypothetical protein [Cytophaga sp. FL35]
MGLNYEQKREMFKEGFKPWKYIVVDVSDYTLEVSRTLQSWSIELLELIRRANQANKIHEMHGIKKNICTQILYKAIDSLMLHRPLKEHEIREYFSRRIEITRFYDGYQDLVRPNGLNPNPEIDYYLLGKFFDVEHDDVPSSLNWSYSTLVYDLETSIIKLEDFIQKSRLLIEKSKLEAEVEMD